MTIGVIVVLIVITLLFGPRPLITILGLVVVGKLLCDIDIDKEYCWYSGIWQGSFFLSNFIRHLIWDTPYKAELYTVGYNIWYWIFSIISTLGFIFGGGKPNRY